ncbi:MAG: methyl-accepting chemotaxis protein [Candidatus Schekmanbacteria bacterium]|nr:methyl-accepting chemotaxis protein [Candidatus Schekmanbacteria bacterium]
MEPLNVKQSRVRRRNYLSKKGMQGRLVGKIIAMVLLAIFLSIGVTSVLYFKLSNQEFKGDVPFYYVPEGAQAAVEVPTAFDVLFPGLLICGVIMVCMTLVIGVLISHRLGGPITNLQRSINEIGKGNLNMEIKLRRGDEFQDLAEDLEDMLEKIRQPINKIQQEVVSLSNHPDLDRFHDLKEGLVRIASELKYFKAE